MNQIENTEQLQTPPIDTMVEALCRVIESRMVECYQPRDDEREVVVFLGLG